MLPTQMGKLTSRKLARNMLILGMIQRLPKSRRPYREIVRYVDEPPVIVGGLTIVPARRRRIVEEIEVHPTKGWGAASRRGRKRGNRS